MLQAIFYHDIFDYPLTLEDLKRWKTDKIVLRKRPKIVRRGKYFFLSGKGEIVAKRRENEKNYLRKMFIAKRAAKVLAKVPTIKMIALSGSCAMKNCKDESDVDILVIASSGTLWTTRILVYLKFLTNSISFRKHGESDEKDKVCINIWLDERSLSWPKAKRNIYTAHEIAQLELLLNRDKTYQKFLWQNRWILDWWPNAVKISDIKTLRRKPSWIFKFVEPIVYRLQRLGKRKSPQEVVTSKRALFHPVDWGKIVLRKLSS